MRRRSKARQRQAVVEGYVRQEVFSRDGECLLAEMSACHGGPTFHHRRKASAGGAYVSANGALLCAGHNDLIEDDPAPFVHGGAFAHLGLVVREGDPEWESLGRRVQRWL